MATIALDSVRAATNKHLFHVLMSWENENAWCKSTRLIIASHFVQKRKNYLAAFDLPAGVKCFSNALIILGVCGVGALM